MNNRDVINKVADAVLLGDEAAREVLAAEGWELIKVGKGIKTVIVPGEDRERSVDLGHAESNIWIGLINDVANGVAVKLAFYWIP